MYDLLLRYTDAVPDQVDLLVGSEATRESILKAIMKSASTRQTILPAAFDDTFLLYFAGYGLSIAGAGARGVTRCIVPADFDPARPVETCLSTSQLNSALDAVGKALVVADTSYDGFAGEHSRTYRTYVAPDSDWRLTSGTENPDRAFLVATGANDAALETPEGGLFTVALDAAIRRHFDDSPRRPQELPLFQAFERARELMSTRSQRRQVPVMKGVLSAPFVFVPRPIDEIKREADGIERAVRNDVVAMRSVDVSRLARAGRLYDKVLSLAPADVTARLGRARVRLLNGDFNGTQKAVDETLRLATELEAPELSEWMELKMQLGDVNGAIADAERAAATSPSPAGAALLGMLYGARGYHEKSLTVLEPLLLQQSSDAGGLTDEELGRIFLHTYLSLRRSGQRLNGVVLLETFFDRAAGGNGLKSIYRNRFLSTLIPPLRPALKMGEVGVQAQWLHVVAQFLREGGRSDDAIRSFQRDVEPYDPRDTTAFECLMHFYVGMARSINGDVQGAVTELQKVVDTQRTEYVEYWFARNEMVRLKG
jgi:tetratricopeptide (TPR) repeat protein